jgi:hypothetical protein
MKRIIIFLSILLIFASNAAFAQIPDFCLTKDEYRLYTMISEYRKQNGLNIIPVSKSLCYVAKIHARDLFINNPDTSSCSLNSWSDKGLWTSCCHSRSSPNPNCILNKPKELTGYSGEGHELTYWDSRQLHPDTVLRFWQSIEQTRDILLNLKKWSNFNWKAIGVGLYKGYACVWVSEVVDNEPEPTLCAETPGADNLVLPLKNMPKEVVTSPTGRYYLIFGSFNTLEDAVKMVDKYKKEGFYQSKILVNEESYRVSLSDHATQQEALDAKKMLGEAYKEAWITKY